MVDSSIVLSFHETLLHTYDVNLLRGPYWLNDTIISFYFEYLEKNVHFKEKSLLFVSPEVTQCIKMVGVDEIKIFLEPLYVQNKSFVFFALNDNKAADLAGGTHWSLLVFSRPEWRFFHFDSSGMCNSDVAWNLVKNLSVYLMGRLADPSDFVRQSCRQQENSYDCGIHVLCTTDLVSRHVLRYEAVAGCGSVERDILQNKRRDVLNVIEMLC